MASSFYSQYLNVAKEAALAAGSIIKSCFNQNFSLDTQIKSCEADMFTKYDVQCQEIIIKIISSHYPEHYFFGEESIDSDITSHNQINQSSLLSFLNKEDNINDSYLWVIDPIDGTTNFIHSFPWTCISIALMINKEVIIGCIYAPIINELYTAIKGHGAYCNDQKINVSKIKHLNKSIIATEVGYDRTIEGINELTLIFTKLLKEKVHSIRYLGSAALNLCSVACGRVDGYFEGRDDKFGMIKLRGQSNYFIGIKIWDIVAGMLIVYESGGFISDTSNISLTNEIKSMNTEQKNEECENLRKSLYHHFQQYHLSSGRICATPNNHIYSQLMNINIDRRYQKTEIIK